MRPVFASPASSAVIDAARHWRLARDLGQPVQPFLSARLGIPGSGLLAPVLDGLLTLFEAAFGRRFGAGSLADTELTRDEQRLLELLDQDGPAEPSGQLRPNLVPALRTALRSTRIMLRWVLGRAPGDTSAAPIGVELGQPPSAPSLPAGAYGLRSVRLGHVQGGRDCE